MHAYTSVIQSLLNGKNLHIPVKSNPVNPYSVYQYPLSRPSENIV